MKKTFQLLEKNKKPERTLEAIKNEIRKYMKRERKKKLPEDAIFWEFDCRFGKDEASAVVVGSSTLIKALDTTKEEAWQECYIEIISRPSDKRREKAKEI